MLAQYISKQRRDDFAALVMSLRERMVHLNLNISFLQADNIKTVYGQAERLQRIADLLLLQVERLSLSLNLSGQILHNLRHSAKLVSNELTRFKICFFQ